MSVASKKTAPTEDEAFEALIEKQQATSTEPAPDTRKVLPYCQKDMLAIVGTAPTMQGAPYTDEKFEIWSVAQAVSYPAFKRYDVLYEMHTEGYWKDPPVLKRLQETKAPIMVMHKHNPEIPGSVPYPIELMTAKYRRYHTTSITYMLAWALHSFLMTKKPYHVALFGVHMEAREEYTTQRPCCEYWLARMEQAGMDVFMAGGAILASQGLYGYENYDPVCWKIRQRITGLTQGVNIRANEEHSALLQKHEQIGAMKEAEYWLREAQTGGLLTLTTQEKDKMAAEPPIEEKTS